MPRLNRLDPTQGDPQAQQMLAQLEGQKMLLNIFRGMANSPAVLDAYLKFNTALKAGKLSEKVASGMLYDGQPGQDGVRGMPPVTPPAIWFPYGRMGQSASEPIWDTTGGKFGPFAGQCFVGDQTKSMVMRVYLEKINGRYQGACFPFRSGFICGVNRLDFGPDGSLFAGMTARGWGSVGGKPYPVSLRALLFEEMVCPIDLSYSKAAAPTFARTLKERFETELRGAVSVVTTHVAAVQIVPHPDEAAFSAGRDSSNFRTDPQQLCRRRQHSESGADRRHDVHQERQPFDRPSPDPGRHRFLSEKARFPQYWPFRRNSRQSSVNQKRADLEVEMFGSANNIRTAVLLVNTAHRLPSL